MGYRLEQCTDEGDTIAAAIAAEQVATATGTAIASLAQSDTDAGFYRPTPFQHIADSENGLPTIGAQRVLGMLHLGGAFRLIEQLYDEGAIDFKTRRIAGNLLCDKFKDLQDELTMWDFSRGNSENVGRK